MTVGSIRVGTAASGQFFTFGASRADDTNGTLVPFLTPGGPAGIAPVDLFIVIAAAAVMVWASVGVKIRAPYAVPVAVLLVAGAAGALAGPVPTAGLVALIQDVWLLAWAIVVANVARSPTGLRLILKAWVIASVAWARPAA